MAFPHVPEARTLCPALAARPAAIRPAAPAPMIKTFILLLFMRQLRQHARRAEGDQQRVNVERYITYVPILKAVETSMKIIAQRSSAIPSSPTAQATAQAPAARLIIAARRAEQTAAHSKTGNQHRVHPAQRIEAAVNEQLPPRIIRRVAVLDGRIIGAARQDRPHTRPHPPAWQGSALLRCRNSICNPERSRSKRRCAPSPPASARYSAPGMTGVVVLRGP